MHTYFYRHATLICIHTLTDMPHLYAYILLQACHTYMHYSYRHATPICIHTLTDMPHLYASILLQTYHTYMHTYSYRHATPICIYTLTDMHVLISIFIIAPRHVHPVAEELFSVTNHQFSDHHLSVKNKIFPFSYKLYTRRNLQDRSIEILLESH